MLPAATYGHFPSRGTPCRPQREENPCEETPKKGTPICRQPLYVKSTCPKLAVQLYAQPVTSAQQAGEQKLDGIIHACTMIGFTFQGLGTTEACCKQVQESAKAVFFLNNWADGED